MSARNSVVTAMLLSVASVFASCREAQAGFVVGSSFTVQGQNSPGNFREVVTLAPGTSLIAGGRLSLTQSIVTQGGGEWLSLYIRSTQGPLVTNINASWRLDVEGVQVDPSAFNTAKMIFWTINGEPAGPISPFRAFNPVAPNPLDPLGRDAYLLYYDVPTIQGTLGQSAWNQPFRLLYEGGINPNLVDGVVMAFKITPAVPEPAGFVMLGLGSAVLCGIAGRRLRV